MIHTADHPLLSFGRRGEGKGEEWSGLGVVRLWRLPMNRRIEHGDWEDTELESLPELCVLPISALRHGLREEQHSSWCQCLRERERALHEPRGNTQHLTSNAQPPSNSQ